MNKKHVDISIRLVAIDVKKKPLRLMDAPLPETPPNRPFNGVPNLFYTPFSSQYVLLFFLFVNSVFTMLVFYSLHTTQGLSLPLSLSRSLLRGFSREPENLNGIIGKGRGGGGGGGRTEQNLYFIMKGFQKRITPTCCIVNLISLLYAKLTVADVYS